MIVVFLFIGIWLLLLTEDLTKVYKKTDISKGFFNINTLKKVLVYVNIYLYICILKLKIMNEKTSSKTINEIQENVRLIVKEYIIKNYSYYGLNEFSNDDLEHVINMGTELLMAKNKIGYEPCGFIKAIINNDLMESFNRADDVNSKALKFYVILLYNVSI